MLDVSKDDIEHYAHQQKLEWVQDESNTDERFTRNFLRQSVIPIIKDRFPKMEVNIVSSARRIETDYAMLSQFANSQLEAWCNEFGGLDLSFITSKLLDERLFWLRHFFQRKNISLPHAQLESIEDMFTGGDDKQPEFTCVHGRILRHQNSIYLLPLDQPVVLSLLIVGEAVKRPFDEICIL